MAVRPLGVPLVPEVPKPHYRVSHEGATARRQRFAELYVADPKADTFKNATGALIQLYAELGQVLEVGESANRMAHRYLQHDETQAAITLIQQRNRQAVDYHAPEYIERCLKREEMLVTRGGKGDAAAAAAYMKMAGDALGLFVKKVENVTPPGREGSPEDRVLRLIEAVGRLKRLNEPAPLPATVRVLRTLPTEALEHEVIEEAPSAQWHRTLREGTPAPLEDFVVGEVDAVGGGVIGEDHAQPES